MKAVSYFVALAACLAIGYFAVSARDKATQSVSMVRAGNEPANLPPESMIGRKVKVYFRGVDDIAAPHDESSQISLAVKLEYLSGTVLSVRPGWLELSGVDQPTRPALWVPSSSMAFVMADESAPTTTPTTSP
jgi:hypothetical protein